MRALSTHRWLKLLLVACIWTLVVWRFASWPEPRYSAMSGSVENALVARVIDGDTLELAGGDRVRLIGIDTPEFGDGVPEPFAVEAKQFTRHMVAGSSVHLQFDRERFDKYGRILATVHVDGKCLSEELARAGLGRVLTRFRYSALLKKRLLAAEEEARSLRLGVWSKR